MTAPTDDDLARLDRLAMAATAGPWRVHKGWMVNAGRLLIATIIDEEYHGHNAAYIAAANPAVVLNLITEIRRLRKQF